MTQSAEATFGSAVRMPLANRADSSWQNKASESWNGEFQTELRVMRSLFGGSDSIVSMSPSVAIFITSLVWK